MNQILTYFTPTWNRGYLLTNLYESLINQTNKNFEWMIVDDGSTDNTKELVEKWQNDRLININYIYKDNGGKHTAIELANQECRTKYITCIDSDDRLDTEATDIILKYINQYSNDNDIFGFVGRRSHYDGTPFSSNWPAKAKKLYFNQLAKEYKYNFDTILVFKTNIINKYHFPNIPDEKFITETVLYNQFFYNYKVVTIQECIYLAEYQSDGYTNMGSKLFYNNPKGYLYALQQNAYISIKHKEPLFERLKKVSYYYSWKYRNKLRKTSYDKYRLKWYYRIIGSILGCCYTVAFRIKKLFKK